MRVHNISNLSVSFHANTNKKVLDALKENNIAFEKTVKADVHLVTIPPQTIIEVCDGEVTQAELMPAYKGKVLKDVTNQTQFLGGDNSKLQKEKQALIDDISNLTQDILNLQKEKQALIDDIASLEKEKESIKSKK